MQLGKTETAKLVAVCTDDKVNISLNADVGDFLNIIQGIMKKILFCLQTMIRGGVEKELLTILPYFSKKNYSVSVLIMYDSDKEISDQVSVKGAKLINLDIDKNIIAQVPKPLFFKG